MTQSQIRKNADPENPSTVVYAASAAIATQHKVARFRGRPMVLVTHPYPHFIPLRRELFDELAYPVLGGVTRSRMADVFAFLSATSPDISGFDRYILFGRADDPASRLWDTRALVWVPTTEVDPAHAIWRSPYAPSPAPGTGGASSEHTPVPFLLSLAGGDQELYDDIMQSLAPLVMEQKPDGVIWWIGDGANGKSTLMDAIYQIFPGQLSSLTVKRLTDGRDTPSLNGTLANIVKESSEGRIEDTEIYKAIGTHEDFRVHKFHSQDDVTIRGNLHHIFSANTIPVFNDKGWSARRRTFIVPFTQRFESDPTFEQRTFIPELFGQIVAEMCWYAAKLRVQGYRYKWSVVTLGAKENYDTDANNAEEYARAIIAEGVVGFESFAPLKMDYENWCAGNGYVPLGASNLRRAVQGAGFDRASYQQPNGSIAKNYRLPNVKWADMGALSLGRPGLYTTTGFAPAEQVEEGTPQQPEAQRKESESEKQTILKGKW